ncbi:hypothetical protein AB1Y20_001196 [Prymnesium parvum]|uniref:NAD-dependent epimerase/dehydratase domain-containing protein n=1 Tax=Prymnesium parvum TaxID=97485 RepID=A0AB34K807_PRYPA
MNTVDDDDRTPLRGGVAREDLSPTKSISAQRWPWVLLGVFLGLLAVLFSNGAKPDVAAAAGQADSAAATTCGSVPMGVPFVRRKLTEQVTNVLVTGGGGFIGSHFALSLIDKKGFNITLVDDLSRGSIETVLRLQALAAQHGQELHFEQLDVNEGFKMAALLKRNRVDLVVHFSGNAYVGESMSMPQEYYQNITASTVSLVRAMHSAGVHKLIFSSSCATFGAPKQFPITEASPQRPTNPYGQAKLQAEQAIVAFLRAQERAGAPFSAALLRYFNVIGADPDGRLGPHLRHEANAKFPRIVDAAYDVALGVREKMTVMGSSFPTKDGSAQRDYIHVSDLVHAHLKLMYALRDNDLLFYNVGNGQPYTVLEIVEQVRQVTGKPIPITLSKERPGDPPILYTDPAKIQYEIGWRPRYPDIHSMILHGWNWRVKHYGRPPAPSIDPLAHNGACFNSTTDEAPPLGNNPRIVVIGAGPTGLCAAYRLTELGYTNWELVEATAKPSGLACTIQDEKKFQWDIGVHCLFSHFEFFDALLDNMLPPKDWLYHQRYSPARMRGTWVGYPVQSNLWRLPEAEVSGIIADLAQKEVTPQKSGAQIRNFKDWLEAGFGKALTDTFMAPYNAKVWAHPAEEMNYIWVGERVATIQFKNILSNVINKRDAPAWGPNAQFRYPMNGTGHIWVKVFDALPKERKRLGARVEKVHTKPGAKAVVLQDGTRIPFDGLLSTMPLPHLLRMTPDHPELAELAEGNNGAADHSKFKHQTANIIGVGIDGTAMPAALNGVHWVYFPEKEYIFYRVTVLSNFSPLMVAKPFKQWSLLIEVSESRHRHEVLALKGDRAALRARVIEGLHMSGMLPRNATIVSVWDTRLEYGYPVPYVERNMHVHAADKALRQLGVWSRGRFGSWKYEVGNQDHSCMLGYDAVDSMLFGGNDQGREATFNLPNKVNNMVRPYDRMFDRDELARQAGRQHTFGAPYRRLKQLPQWDWVTYHCRGTDEWLDKIREVMIAQPEDTKWLIHGYEVCGFAKVKRPMHEMLREGLNHHDRIPHPMADSAPTPFPVSGWVRHIIAHYKRLPDILFFAPSDVPASSRLFSSAGRGSIIAAMKESADFGMWGTRIVDMPAAMHTTFCKVVWPLTARAEKRKLKRSCPERVVTMAEPVILVSKSRILNTPLETWKKVLSLLEDATAGKGNDELFSFGWHLLFGQGTVLPPRFMHEH